MSCSGEVIVKGGHEGAGLILPHDSCLESQMDGSVPENTLTHTSVHTMSHTLPF